MDVRTFLGQPWTFARPWVLSSSAASPLSGPSSPSPRSVCVDPDRLPQPLLHRYGPVRHVPQDVPPGQPADQDDGLQAPRLSSSLLRLTTRRRRHPGRTRLVRKLLSQRSVMELPLIDAGPGRAVASQDPRRDPHVARVHRELGLRRPQLRTPGHRRLHPHVRAPRCPPCLELAFACSSGVWFIAASRCVESGSADFFVGAALTTCSLGSARWLLRYVAVPRTLFCL